MIAGTGHSKAVMRRVKRSVGAHYVTTTVTERVPVILLR